MENNYQIERLFQKSELIPVVIQHWKTGKVLMVGFTDRIGVQKSMETGKACFYSRSRKQFWMKGETSGNFLLIKEIRIDCDEDTLLYQCDPMGPTCHTGNESCFYRSIWEVSQ